MNLSARSGGPAPTPAMSAACLQGLSGEQCGSDPHGIDFDDGGRNVDVSYINPFVEGLDSVFKTMLDVTPKRNAVKIGAQGHNGAHLTLLIGISGMMHGCVALSFPPATALALAGRMLGSELTEINDEVIDAISELVNMVAGSAKAKFNVDPPLQLGLPTVVEGTGYRVKYPSKSIWLEVPYSSNAGDFSMEVTYTPN